MGAGKIWLDRKILDWEWWNDINTFRLFTYCLLKANWKDSKFQGVDVPRGSFVTSVTNLANNTNLSVRQIRTAISHLKATGEVTVKRHAKFSVVIVNNYNRYQSSDTLNDSDVTVKRHSSDTVATTIEESNKDNKLIINNINQSADEFFEELWKQYPFLKQGKGQVKTPQRKRLLGIGRGEMERAIERFKLDMQGREPKYIMRGGTFFNSGYVDYLDKNYCQSNMLASNMLASDIDNVVHTENGDYEVVTLDDL